MVPWLLHETLGYGDGGGTLWEALAVLAAYAVIFGAILAGLRWYRRRRACRS
jgi:hypothetical protein